MQANDGFGLHTCRCCNSTIIGYVVKHCDKSVVDTIKAPCKRRIRPTIIKKKPRIATDNDAIVADDAVESSNYEASDDEDDESSDGANSDQSEEIGSEDSTPSSSDEDNDDEDNDDNGIFIDDSEFVSDASKKRAKTSRAAKAAKAARPVKPKTRYALRARDDAASFLEQYDEGGAARKQAWRSAYGRRLRQAIDDVEHSFGQDSVAQRKRLAKAWAAIERGSLQIWQAPQLESHCFFCNTRREKTTHAIAFEGVEGVEGVEGRLGSHCLLKVRALHDLFSFLNEGAAQAGGGEARQGDDLGRKLDAHMAALVQSLASFAEKGEHWRRDHGIKI